MVVALRCSGRLLARTDERLPAGAASPCSSQSNSSLVAYVDGPRVVHDCGCSTSSPAPGGTTVTVLGGAGRYSC